MTSRIIVADDSTTIQKVVRITLASEPVEIIECLTDEELASRALANDFDLLLLDFNLSESKSGYQLASDLRAQGITAPILAMLGTFDTIDEDELNKSGIDDRIIKPFESDIFIQKCRELFEKGRPEVVETASELPVEEVIEEVSSDVSEGEEWVVDSPEIDFGSDETDSHDISSFDLDSPENALDKELEGWGIEIPAVIDAGAQSSEGEIAIPPVIGAPAENFGSIEMQPAHTLSADDAAEEEVDFDIDATSTFDINEFENKYDQSLPEDDDLAYPDLGGDNKIEGPESKDDFDFGEMQSAPTSIEELTPEEEDKLEDQFSVEASKAKSDALERELETELENDDIWAIDEEFTVEDAPLVDEVIADEALAPEESFVVEETPEEEEIVFDASVEESHPSEMPQVSAEEIVEKLMESITPLVEEMIKKHCHEAVERVAWEVIPDLAENLIKKEIKDISESL